MIVSELNRRVSGFQFCFSSWLIYRKGVSASRGGLEQSAYTSRHDERDVRGRCHSHASSNAGGRPMCHLLQQGKARSRTKKTSATKSDSEPSCCKRCMTAKMTVGNRILWHKSSGCGTGAILAAKNDNTSASYLHYCICLSYFCHEHPARRVTWLTFNSILQ